MTDSAESLAGDDCARQAGDVNWLEGVDRVVGGWLSWLGFFTRFKFS